MKEMFKADFGEEPFLQVGGPRRGAVTQHRHSGAAPVGDLDLADRANGSEGATS